jgi:hypothetical protein
MATTTPSGNIFDLGLALAGAVSAGAYTAGVLDFLFQALNEWEKARTEPVYMTVSNVRGIPFTVQFGNSTYGMQTHGDRAHYEIEGLGSAANARNGWIDNDSSETLSVVDLLGTGPSVPPQWDGYGTCALASSAFPIGLAPRRLTAPIDGYLRRSYPITGGAYAISPSFPPDETGRFGSLNVDGGLTNNNPFDYAQFTLMGDASAKKTDGAEADRSVIMVAPFPEPPAFLPRGQPVASSSRSFARCSRR